MAYEVVTLRPDLVAKKLTVTLRAPDGSYVSTNSIPFDPPGNQTEDQLLALARETAKRALLAAAEAL